MGADRRLCDPEVAARSTPPVVRSHVYPTPESMGREGMVTVWASDGLYLGCMGIETWKRQLEPPVDEEPLGLRIKQLAARFGGLIPPDRNATETILSKIYADVDALVDALKEARHG